MRHYHDHRDGYELALAVVCVLALLVVVAVCAGMVADAYQP